MNDKVNHPAHYTRHPSGVECIQITEHMGFNLGNALKYIWRCDLKADAIEDLKKAVWYIEREIAKREQPSDDTWLENPGSAPVGHARVDVVSAGTTYSNVPPKQWSWALGSPDSITHWRPKRLGVSTTGESVERKEGWRKNYGIVPNFDRVDLELSGGKICLDDEPGIFNWDKKASDPIVKWRPSPE